MTPEEISQKEKDEADDLIQQKEIIIYYENAVAPKPKEESKKENE